MATKYVEYFEMQDAGNVYVRDAEAHDRIDDLETSLTNSINAVNTSLTASIGDVSDDVTALESSVAEDISDVNDSIATVSGNVTAVENSLNSARAILKRRIKKVGTYLIAHAGNAGDAPENSKIGILRACMYHFNGVEFDTQITSDNIPVVAHNDDLATFTNKTGLISTSNYSAISDAVITVGPYNALYTTAEKTLSTVVDALNIIRRNQNVTPFIDIKDSYDTVGEMQALLEAVDATGMRYETIFLCDSMTKAQNLISCDSNVAIMLVTDTITNEIVAFCDDNELIGIDCSVGSLTRSWTDAIHKRGLLVGIWTINENNLSSLPNYRVAFPDMYTVWSPAFFATRGGLNYGTEGSAFYHAYRMFTNGIVAATPYDYDLIVNGNFTWHTSQSATDFNNHLNYCQSMRAIICKKFPCKNGDVVKLKAPTDYNYSVRVYDENDALLVDSGWITDDYTINNANAAFYYLGGRRTDNGNLTVIDMMALERGASV